jgi:catechol 1,2-dioxygenase
VYVYGPGAGRDWRRVSLRRWSSGASSTSWYQIPTDGATGALIRAAGWHAWRPAHLHMKVSAPGYQLITRQLYFPGDPRNQDDIASAVKPELMLDPKPAAGGHGVDVEYDYVLDPA